MKTLKKRFFLKDQLFNKQKVEYLGNLIFQAYPGFDKKRFVKKVVGEFKNLELKERVFWIEKKLAEFLPRDYERALSIILRSLPPELNNNKKDNDFGDFIFSPFQHFVVKQGMEPKYLKKSLDALAELTLRFSVEDGIRFFVNTYPKATFIFMKKMSRSSKYHQRRLASEGLRPKLPWCIAIDMNYQKPIEILDRLYDDPTRYVVRSVANHLNDISKIDPNLVVKTLKRWKKELEKKTIDQYQEKEFAFLTSHALRTAVKEGHKESLEFLGFTTKPKVRLSKLTIVEKNVLIGEFLDFGFDIESISKNHQNILIDYIVTYPMGVANKKSKKVFRLKSLTLGPYARETLTKRKQFALMTTKRLYPGEHSIAIQVNGSILVAKTFNLLDK